MDTGAAANLLSEADYRLLSDRPKLHKASVRLTDYNNKEIHAVESCVLSCVGNADCLRIRFIVMKGGPSLLGHEACEKLYLVRRILNKEECSRIRKVLKVQAEAEVVNDIQNYTLPDVREKLSSLPFTHDIVLRENCTTRSEEHTSELQSP